MGHFKKVIFEILETKGFRIFCFVFLGSMIIPVLIFHYVIILQHTFSFFCLEQLNSYYNLGKISRVNRLCNTHSLRLTYYDDVLQHRILTYLVFADSKAS